MPNRYVRDANGNIVPKGLSIVGGITDSTVVNADIANSTIQAGKISFFKSTEQTGTGSEQNIAHGLGRTPALVIVFPTEGDGNAFDIAEGTHDSTNIKITTGAAVKFKVIAL